MVFYRFRSFTFLYLIFAIVSLLFAIHPNDGFAQVSGGSGDVIVIDGIALDVTGSNPLDARNKAIDEGQRKALLALWEKLVPAAQIASIPPVDTSQLTSFVRDFSLADEKTTDVRYIATMTVRFHAGVVRDFLIENGISYTAVSTAPLLVIPVWVEGGQVNLWRQPNPWYDVWYAGQIRGTLVQVVVPSGDLQDVQALPDEAVENLDPIILSQLESRYNASGVLLTKAEVVGGEDGLAKLSITSQHTKGGDSSNTSVQVVQKAGEDAASFLIRAGREVISSIELGQKEGSIVNTVDQQFIIARVPIQTLASWLEIQNKISTLGEVSNFRILALSNTMAVIRLEFFGSLDRLSKSLGYRGLSLVPLEVQPVAPGGVNTIGVYQERPEWEIRSISQNSPAPEEVSQ